MSEEPASSREVNAVYYSPFGHHMWRPQAVQRTMYKKPHRVSESYHTYQPRPEGGPGRPATHLPPATRSDPGGRGTTRPISRIRNFLMQNSKIVKINFFIFFQRHSVRNINLSTSTKGRKTVRHRFRPPRNCITI